MTTNKRRFLRPHYFSFAIGILVVALAGYFSYRDWKEYEANSQEADRGRLFDDQIRTLVALVTDAESGQRGYLLTGDEQYLEPYRAALPRIRDLTGELAPSTAVSAGRVMELSGLITAKLTELESTIQERRAGRVEEATRLVRSNRGKETMDQIRAVATHALEVQGQYIRRREAVAHRHQVRTQWVVLLGSALLGALLLVGALSADRLLRDAEKQQATLATTLSSIGDAIIATDATGRVSFMNPVAETLTGWSAGEAREHPLPEVFHIVNESTHAEVESPVTRVLQSGRVVGLANHTLLLQRNGREIPIDDSGAPIRSQDGGISGVILVFRDVADRRRGELALESSEKRYRLLFENNPQPMWVYDVDTLAFLAINNAAVQRYGYSREEFLRMTLRDIRPGEDVAALLEATKAAPTGWNMEGPWRHMRKDGTVFQVEISEHPLQFDGRAASLVLATDITERVRLEELFRQSQKLESIGRLAGGVAHDFNNLLTVINGYSEMILSRLTADSTLRDSLSEILGAGGRASALTQQLLAFSRKQLVQPSVINLNDVIVDIQKMLRRLIGEDIKLATKLEPALGHVRADTGQIQQIILNLSVNARDAMPDGGTLQLETANVLLDESYSETHPGVTPGPHVLLAVTDTGLGMTAEVRNRLFEPFFTTKPKGLGTGLGLATVYGMVKQSGGWIWVYSELGQGTTFKIYLPRTDAARTPAVARPKTDLRGRETILVVEDQDDVRMLVVRALDQLGYRVLSAAGGEEALQIAGDFPEHLDLLLTDVVMPGMNGRTLAKTLLVSRPDLRVLYMSGYTENAVAHRGVLDSEVEFLQKPFTAQVLGERVREVLGPAPVSATILLVDDDPAVRRLLTQLLADSGYGVVEASSGRRALELLAQGDAFGVVICDLLMPEEEDAATIRALRRAYPRLPIVAISGAFGDGVQDSATQLSVQATLPKPVDAEVLLKTVRRFLSA